MNEAIQLEFRRGGDFLPVTFFDQKQGIVFAAETSAAPIATAIGIVADSPITAKQMDFVRQRMDWEPPKYKFNLTFENNRFRIHGVDDQALPAGDYKVTVELGGVKLLANQFRVKVKKDSAAQVVATLAPDREIFEFKQDMIADADVSASVLKSADSTIDGQPVMQWLAQPGGRIQRKACLLNLLASLRTTPGTTGSLCEHVKSVFFAGVDRIYIAADRRYRDVLVAIPEISHEGKPTAAIHQQLIQRIPGGAGRKFDLESFRVREFNSLQSVLAIPEDGGDTIFVDVDIDLGNPLSSLGGLIVHIGELINPDPTDHLRLFHKLREQPGLSDFLYYGLSKATAAGTGS
jgi:hypothetical protein